MGRQCSISSKGTCSAWRPAPPSWGCARCSGPRRRLLSRVKARTDYPSPPAGLSWWLSSRAGHAPNSSGRRATEAVVACSRAAPPPAELGRGAPEEDQRGAAEGGRQPRSAAALAKMSQRRSAGEAGPAGRAFAVKARPARPSSRRPSNFRGLFHQGNEAARFRRDTAGRVVMLPHSAAIFLPTRARPPACPIFLASSVPGSARTALTTSARPGYRVRGKRSSWTLPRYNQLTGCVLQHTR